MNILKLEVNKAEQILIKWSAVQEAVSYCLKICNQSLTAVYEDVIAEMPEYTLQVWPDEDEIRVTISALNENGEVIESEDELVNNCTDRKSTRLHSSH